MAPHARFHYRSPEELRSEARSLGLDLPWSEDGTGVLLEPIAVGGRRVPNRLAVQPMEGADAGPDGGPGELTLRRYERFGEGNWGLIWFEAAAVTPDGRSNPRQLRLTRGTLDGFKRLVERTRDAARGGLSPLLILQLTHSGRFAKPEGRPAPIIAQHEPSLDGLFGLPFDHPVVGDATLDRLQDAFVGSADLAIEAGFDGVDIKACHGYLVAELLGARLRDGRYGGDYDKRTRFLREVVGRVRDRASGSIPAVRLNAFDALPYPNGFGSSPGEGILEDLTEPKRLAADLAVAGAVLLNVTAGVPHLRPHVGRPFDKPVAGGIVPPEHPLEGVVRLLRLASSIREAIPGTPVVGTGYSWLRQFAPEVAAGVIRREGADLAGFGRMVFAYPDLPRDLARDGRLSSKKVCVACSGCSELPRAGRPSGCVVRDPAFYPAVRPLRAG